MLKGATSFMEALTATRLVKSTNKIYQVHEDGKVGQELNAPTFRDRR